MDRIKGEGHVDLDISKIACDCPDRSRLVSAAASVEQVELPVRYVEAQLRGRPQA